jgi:integrase
MKAKVVLLARINDGLKYPFLSVPIKRGRPEQMERVTGYYIRYSRNGQRVVKPVGRDLNAAFVAYQNEELNLSRRALGLTSVDTHRIRIADAVREYIEELESSVRMQKKSRKTLEGYQKAVEDFQKNCGCEFIDQITGKVLKAHERYLFDNLKKRVYGKKANTIATRFRNISAFLSKQGIQMVKHNPTDKGLLDRTDVPREERKVVNKYSQSEINGMLSVANIDEADLIQTFLRTGCRDEEIAYLHWSDIDWTNKQMVISEKTEYQWRPKDKEARTIPLEDGVLLARLANRKDRQPDSKLVFPNKLDHPDMNLIKRLQKVVEKAKANGTKFEGVIALHRFRRTYASMMIEHSDLQTVSALLGHSDIKTTVRYLAVDLEKARTGSRKAFQNVLG